MFYFKTFLFLKLFYFKAKTVFGTDEVVVFFGIRELTTAGLCRSFMVHARKTFLGILL